MAEYVLMPKLGFNMDTGQLVEWRKKEGESFKRGEVLFVMMTDKTAMEVEATGDAVLLKILAQPGKEVAVTLPIAIVGQTGDDITDLGVAFGKQASDPVIEAVKATLPVSGAVAMAPTPVGTGADQKLSPRARRYLADKKLDIQGVSIQGTGFQGGITEKDIEAHFKKAGGASATVPDAAPVASAVQDQREVLRTVPYTGMRKVIGDRLSNSQATAPHVSFMTSVDCYELVQFRNKVNAALEQKLSILAFVVEAVTQALQVFPQINASLQQDRIIQYKDINVGIAVALDSGLIVPVIKKAQTMKISRVESEIRTLTEKARTGKLSPGEYQGGTFTVSNLGMFDVEQFTSIINPPEAAILGISAMKKTPVVLSEGDEDRVIVRPVLNLTVTVDHRVIDGREAVLFLSETKRRLESPVSLFI